MFVIGVREVEAAFKGLPSLDKGITEVGLHLRDEVFCAALPLTTARAAIHELLRLAVLEFLQNPRTP